MHSPAPLFSCSILLAICVGCSSTHAPHVSPATPEEGAFLAWLRSFDRGIGRFVAMGPNLAEGLGREMENDGLVAGVLPGSANLLTEGVAADVLVRGVTGGFLSMGGLEGSVLAVDGAADSITTSTHASLVGATSYSRDNVARLGGRVQIRDESYVEIESPLGNADRCLGALAGMPLGIVRQIGDNFDRNGLVIGVAETVPVTVFAVVTEIGGGLGRFATLLVGETEAADSVRRWQRDSAGSFAVFGEPGNARDRRHQDALSADREQQQRVQAQEEAAAAKREAERKAQAELEAQRKREAEAEARRKKASDLSKPKAGGG